jgi:glutathione synthase/RimK-type ligase-like ATP-grasp enzyme
MAQINEAALIAQAFAAAGAELDVVDVADVAAELEAARDWSRYDAVLPLGCWGYHKDAAGFRAWIERVERSGRIERHGATGVRMINPPEIVKWNLDKSYLLDLQKAGVEVAPLLHFPKGSRPDLGAELRAAGWSRYVVKPTISANSERTAVAEGPPDAKLLALADEILARCGLLVQPFFEEIPAAGEWSLMFFGEALSHTVLKVPKAGDFRSQPDYGARVTGAEPPPAVVEQALAAVRAARPGLAYARVDGFLRDGRLQLVELELIEPYLYMSSAGDGMAAAAARFVAAVLAVLKE